MQEQEIRDWCVAGDDSIVGNVYHRPGHADGETIITSPVVQVRLVGEARIPMAITESGSSYWLGAPSRRFGLDKAEAFVWRLSTTSRPADTARIAGENVTILQGLPVTGDSARTGAGASLAVTCEDCGAVAVATLADELSSVNAATGISIDDPCPACGGHLAARPGKYRLNDATGMLARVGDFGARADADAAAPANEARPRVLRSVR
ncbi:MAG: hypothetical protein ACO1PB_18590 [Ramlibacter sp.]